MSAPCKHSRIAALPVVEGWQQSAGRMTCAGSRPWGKDWNLGRDSKAAEAILNCAEASFAGWPAERELIFPETT